MTDLLSAEDIKKAVGAFAGEQRGPPPSPLPSPTAPAPAPLCVCVRSVPAGQGAGSSAFPKVRAGLGSGGEARHPAPETENLRAPQAGCQASRTGVPNQRQRPGGRQDLRALGVLVRALDFPFKARGRGCRHLRPLSGPFWPGLISPRRGQGCPPPAVRTPHSGAESPLPTTRE